MPETETEDDLELAKHKDFKKDALNGKHKRECNCGYCWMIKNNLHIMKGAVRRNDS